MQGEVGTRESLASATELLCHLNETFPFSVHPLFFS